MRFVLYGVKRFGFFFKCTYSALNWLSIFCLMYMHLIHFKKLTFLIKITFSSNLSQSRSVLEHCLSELVKLKESHRLTIFLYLCPPWLCSLFPSVCSVFLAGLCFFIVPVKTWTLYFPFLCISEIEILFLLAS